tara:strand:+ start:81 stop:488 length:408 start_codon:yes stop_codon:yes gene_type:complete
LSRILGVDYGERRIGLALSDSLKITAQPLNYIDRQITSDYISTILDIAKDKDVHTIVVGVPYNLKGQNSKQTEIVNRFINELRAIGKIKVIPIDERLSSIAAEKSLQFQGVKTGHEKGRVDETAAALLLQEYLDS